MPGAVLEAGGAELDLAPGFRACTGCGSGEAVTTQSLGTPWEGQQAAWEGLAQVSRRRGSCAGGRGRGGTGSSGRVFSL